MINVCSFKRLLCRYFFSYPHLLRGVYTDVVVIVSPVLMKVLYRELNLNWCFFHCGVASRFCSEILSFFSQISQGGQRWKVPTSATSRRSTTLIRRPYSSGCVKSGNGQLQGKCTVLWFPFIYTPVNGSTFIYSLRSRVYWKPDGWYWEHQRNPFV